MLDCIFLQTLFDTNYSGDKIVGPAIVEQLDTTILILPDQTAFVDSYGNLIINAINGGEYR